MRDQNALILQATNRPIPGWISAYLRELRLHPLLLIIGLCWMLIWGGTASAIVCFIGNPLLDAKLDRLGVRAQGSITTVDVDSAVRVNQRHPFAASYEFLDSTGQKHTGKCHVWNPDHAQRLEKSRLVRVLYLPNDPEISKLDGESYRSAPLVLLIVFVGVMLLGIPLVIIGLWFPVKLAGIRIRGVPVLAQVLGIQTRQRAPRGVLELEYDGPGANRIRAQHTVFAAAWLPDVSAGNVLALLMDPKHPTNVAVLETFLPVTES